MLSLKQAEPSSVRQPAHTLFNDTAKAGVEQIPSRVGLDGDILQYQSGCSCGGGCPRCVGVQAKLKVNSPGDLYEQEADRIADQVMRMPPPAIQRKPT